MMCKDQLELLKLSYIQKISMYDWLNKTKSVLDENEFLKLYINFNRQELIEKNITKNF